MNDRNHVMNADTAVLRDTHELAARAMKSAECVQQREPTDLDMWQRLSAGARDTLICLCKHGATWDGDVPSKAGRDELLKEGLAAKVVVAANQQGYQAATYRGSRVYKAGLTERLASARRTMSEALRNDESLRRSYVDNIAMMLHESHGIVDYDQRNKAANDVLNLIFS
jgi:hypothetical protein